MNYEHNDEFGQRPGSNQRNGFQREPGRRPERTPAGNSRQEDERGRRPVRPSGTGRIPQESGMGGRQPGRPPRTGGIPQEADMAGRQSERAAGTGRMPRETGMAERQAGRTQENGRLTGETRRNSGEYQQEGRSGGGREEASARELNVRESSGETGRNKKAAGIRGMGESPREVLAQAKIQKAKRKKRKRRLIAMIIAECLALTVIFTYGYFARRLNLIQREDFNKDDVKNSELSVEDLTKMKGYWMIAVFGVDSRSTSVGAGNQADVNMICCINQDTGEIKLVSVYRDTYLNINDSNSYRKINAAYSNGGPEQALKALNKNLDLNITDYVTFSWKAVAEGINILGGVDVEITRSEFRFINAFITETVKATNIGSHQLPAPGLHHLDGVQAVAYGRLRLMDTDYARTERQRKIIELAFAKAKKADYATLNNILVTTLPSISTNLDFSDLTGLALSIGKYHIGETAGFPFAKGNANMPGKGDCVIPQTLESNVSQLHTFLFGDESYSPTEQVKQISSKIAADSGMHREGKPSKGSALATDSYVPEETTAPRTTEAQETEETSEAEESEESREPMTDENGNMILYPNETDEDGNLIDAPIDDWPEEDPLYPGDNNQTGTGPVGPGTSIGPGGTGGQNSGRPGVPSESSASHNPGTGTVPGSESQPGTTQPSGGDMSGQTPGGNEGPGGTGNMGPGGSSPTDTTSSGSSSTGATSSGGVSPGGSGNPGTGENGGQTGGPGSVQPPSGSQTQGETAGPQGSGSQPSGGQTSNPQPPAEQSSGQPDNGGGPGGESGPGL